MNKNKGIIGIGLILAIVLGIVVVGGGAYYLGKRNNLPPLITKNTGGDPAIKNLPVDNSQQVNCTSNSPSTIKVISPNGGEIYKAGDKITVKWESCNIPATHKFYIGLMPNVESQGSPAITVLSNSTINDGIEIFNLNVGDIDLSYTVFIKDNDLPNGSTNAWSKEFTINSGTTTTWLKSPKFGLYYQNTLNIIEYYIDRYGKQVDKTFGMGVFYAYWGDNQDSGLIWGGNYEATNPTSGGGGAACMGDDVFGEFQYGVSSVTCLQGKVTRVFHVSARNKITEDDLKVFGNFVLKNRQ